MDWMNLNFLKVTEKAAIACAPLRGRFDKHQADEKATSSMRETLNKMDIDATVVIGEGEMDEAPMLYIGEKLGQKNSLSKLDIAVDPLDGTTITAKNQNNAITVIAFTEQGGFLHAPDMYMKKIVVGSWAKGCVDVSQSLTSNLQSYSKATLKKPEDIVVCMLDRPRHEENIKEVIAFGAKVKLVSDGDILPGILTGIKDSGIDILYGIGAAPEGVITAAAIKCLGGDFQGMLVPSNEEEIERAQKMGVKDVKTHLFTLNDLVKKDNIVVVMTAVTDSFIGKGVHFCPITGSIITESLKIETNSPSLQFIKSIYK